MKKVDHFSPLTNPHLHSMPLCAHFFSGPTNHATTSSCLTMCVHPPTQCKVGRAGWSFQVSTTDIALVLLHPQCQDNGTGPAAPTELVCLHPWTPFPTLNSLGLLAN
jgi:hypothetical protein